MKNLERSFFFAGFCFVILRNWWFVEWFAWLMLGNSWIWFFLVWISRFLKFQSGNALFSRSFSFSSFVVWIFHYVRRIFYSKESTERRFWISCLRSDLFLSIFIFFFMYDRFMLFHGEKSVAKITIHKQNIATISRYLVDRDHHILFSHRP